MVVRVKKCESASCQMGIGGGEDCGAAGGVTFVTLLLAD